MQDERNVGDLVAKLAEQIEGLRQVCSWPGHNSNIVTELECEKGCNGLGWLPVSEQEAGWVLMEQFKGVLHWQPSGWYWVLECPSPGPSPFAEHPWEAVIAAAYKALIEHV